MYQGMVNKKLFTWADDHRDVDLLATVNPRIGNLFALTAHMNSLIYFPSHNLHNSPGLFTFLLIVVAYSVLFWHLKMNNIELLCLHTWWALLSPHIPDFRTGKNLTTIQWLWSLIVPMSVPTTLEIPEWKYIFKLKLTLSQKASDM